MAITKPAQGATPWNAATDATIDHANIVSGNPHGTTAAMLGAQPADPDLSTIATLDSATAGVLSTDGGGWIRKTYAQMKTALGLTKADVGLGSVDNVSASSLRERPTHTGQQPSTTISDFTEAVQDVVAGLLGAGSNVLLTYDDAANTLEVSATGAGGSGLDAEQVRDAIGVALVGVGAVAVVVNDAADTITISTTATANSTDAALRDRTTHTGQAPISATTGLQAALDGKAALAHAHAIADVNGLQTALDGKAAAITPNAASSAGGTVAVDAAASFGPSRAISLTGNITVNALSNATDQRRLLVEFYANGGARTVGIAAPVVNGSDATLPLSIPSGKSALVGFYYSTRLGYPVVVSAKVLP